MKKLIVLILVSIFYLSCEKLGIISEGTIEGKFTIGPLCGIESVNADENHPCGFSFEQLDAIYGQYKVQLINESTGKVVAEKKMDRTGLFSFQAEAGIYKLDYNPHVTTVKTQSIPSGITLKDGQKLKFDINVTTGFL